MEIFKTDTLYAPIFIKLEQGYIFKYENITIRKITDDELAYLFNKRFTNGVGGLDDSYNEGASMGSGYAVKDLVSNELMFSLLSRGFSIEYTRDFYKDINKELQYNTDFSLLPIFMVEISDYISRSDLLEDLLLAINILKETKFSCPKWILYRRIKSCMYSEGPTGHSLTENVYKYWLYKNDEDSLSLLTKLIKSNSNKLIRNRLFSVCFNYSIKDELRFIEIISAIESMICGEKGEIAFKFELFIVFILKESNTTISFKIGELYKIRSKLVHKGYDKKFQTNNKKCLDNALKILRIVYKSFLEFSPDEESTQYSEYLKSQMLK